MDPKSGVSPIEQFLAKSAKQLRGRLAAEKVAATVAEAREHLTYRVEELVEEGLAPHAAEAAAVAAFGEPKEWTRDILLSENYKPYLKIANNISIAGFTVFLFAAPLAVLGLTDFARGQFQTPGNLLLISTIAYAAATLGALIARRFAFRTFAGALTIAILVTYFVVGISAVPLAKILKQRMVILAAQFTIQDDLDRLKLGEQVYGGAAPLLPAAVPARLKGPMKGPYADMVMSAGNFFADRANMPEERKGSTFAMSETSGSSSSAPKGPFGYLAPIVRSQPASLPILTKGSLVAVASEEIAAQRWRELAPIRLAECANGLAELETRPVNHLTAMQALSTFRVESFEPAVAKTAAWTVFIQGLICLILCYLHAAFGRFLHRVTTTLRSQINMGRRTPIA